MRPECWSDELAASRYYEIIRLSISCPRNRNPSSMAEPFVYRPRPEQNRHEPARSPNSETGIAAGLWSFSRGPDADTNRVHADGYWRRLAGHDVPARHAAWDVFEPTSSAPCRRRRDCNALGQLFFRRSIGRLRAERRDADCHHGSCGNRRADGARQPAFGNHGRPFSATCPAGHQFASVSTQHAARSYRRG